MVVNYNVQSKWHEKVGRLMRAELKSFLMVSEHFELLCSGLWSWVQRKHMDPIINLLVEYGKYGEGNIPFDALIKAALPVNATSEESEKWKDAIAGLMGSKMVPSKRGMAYLGIIVEAVSRMLKDIARWQEREVSIFAVKIP